MECRGGPKIMGKQTPGVIELHFICVFKLDTNVLCQPHFEETALPLYDVSVFCVFHFCTGFITFREEMF